MNEFMLLAVKEAYEGINKGHGGPFGAVIVKDNQVIASAHNEVLKNGDPTAHAEVQAIRLACKKLKTYNLEDCVMYATGEPCCMCRGAILWARLKHVYYAANSLEIKAIGFDDEKFNNDFINMSSNVLSQAECSECKKLFADYSLIPNKEIY